MATRNMNTNPSAKPSTTTDETATPATTFPATRQEPTRYEADSEPDRGEAGTGDEETDQQREAREASEADQLASNQSGFAQRAELPEVVPAAVIPPALNAAALDGMPVPFDRSTETVIDPHSGAIVSVPVDRDEKSDDVKKNEDKA